MAKDKKKPRRTTPSRGRAKPRAKRSPAKTNAPPREQLAESKRAREEREVEIRLLNACNSAATLRDIMRDVTRLLQDCSGCEAVGIRLRDGDDFPYYETRGFPPEFVETEKWLCQRDGAGCLVRDRLGKPVLECMCGNVLAGRFDAALPFFTAHGSFWTNSTSHLLATTSESDRQTRTRNRCNTAGYESLALAPLRAGAVTIGLLQFNDKRQDRFTAARIAFLGHLADSLAPVIAHRAAEERLEKSEAELREKERRERAILDTIANPVWLKDAEGRYLAVNAAWCRFTGKKPGQVIGKTDFDLLPAEIATMFQAADREAMGPARQFHQEQLVKDASGRAIWHDTSIFPILNEQGEVVGSSGIARDVTERKRAEEELREVHQLLHTVLAHTRVMVVYLDTSFHYVWVNHAYAATCNREASFFSGKNLFDLYPNEEKRAIFQRVVDTGEAFSVSAQPFITPDQPERGVTYWDWSLVPVKETTGLVVGLVFTLAEVTDRVRAEEALRQLNESLESLVAQRTAELTNANESLRAEVAERELLAKDLQKEAFFRAAVINRAAEGICVCHATPDYPYVRFTVWNERMRAMTGYTMDQINRLGWYQTVYPDPEVAERAMRRMAAMRDGVDLLGEEWVITRADGETRTVLISTTILSKDEDPVSVLAVMHDVSERKRAEEALRESSQLIQEVIRSVQEGIIVYGPDLRYQVWNPFMEELTGVPAEEVLGRLPLEVFPYLREMGVIERVEKSLAGETVHSPDFPYHVPRTGRSGWAWDTNGPLRNAKGEVVGVIATVRDVTERKRAELARQARLRLMEFAVSHSLVELLQATLDEAELLSGSQIGFCHFLEADQTTLSLQAWSTRTVREMCAAEGKGSHYDVGKAGVWVDCVRERRPVIHNDYSALPHRKGMPEGHAQVIRELVVPVFREDRIVAILGVGNKPRHYDADDVAIVSMLADLAWDITQRRRAEERLKESEEKFSKAFHGSPLPTALVTTETGRFVDVNEAFLAVLGYDRDETIGHTVFELNLWDSLQDRADLFARVERGETLRNLELRFRAKDRRLVILSASFDVIELRGEPCLLGILEDVTKRRAAEEELQAMQAQLAHVARLSTMGEMAAEMVHELGQPLYAILNYAKACRNTLAADAAPDWDTLRTWNENIVQIAADAGAIGKRFRAFAGQTEPARSAWSSCEVHTIVEESLALVAFEIRQARIQVETVRAAENPVICADRVQIQQVLVNLLKNAIEALVNTAPALRRVTIQTAVAGQNVEITVADNGSGLPPDGHLNIFDAFGTTKPGGLGMGLTISLTIIEGHGGKLWATANPGGGACFHCMLPLTGGCDHGR